MKILYLLCKYQTNAVFYVLFYVNSSIRRVDDIFLWPRIVFIFKFLFHNMLIYKFYFLFTVRGSRPGKNVQLTENEIRGLCLKSREIFLSQPILLELEAPLKICGKCSYFLTFYILYIQKNKSSNNFTKKF